MKSAYALDEQETIINVLPTVVSDKAEIYTCIPPMMNRLLKLQQEYPSDVVVSQGDGYINATVPKDWIKVQPKRKCTLTAEQKQANAERLKAYRNKGDVKT